MLPLEIREVAKRFGGRPALDGVSLDLRDGEVLGLLGPNGAGKSTLVRTIMGRVRPDRGEVRIFGKPAPAGDTVARAAVGVVPQEIALYLNLSSFENLCVFGRYSGLRGAELDGAVARALEWAGLSDRAGEPVSSFSGGMKRRLNMAAGVLHRPRVLLLDEPTVGVDPQSRERIYQMIEALRRDGVSLIYTTHYMEEAERLCDRIAVIDGGKLIASGTQEELVRSTIGEKREVSVTCDLQGHDALRNELAALGARINEHSVRYLSEGSAGESLRIVRMIEASNIPVRDLTMKAPSLENVFLHLTGKDLRE